MVLTNTKALISFAVSAQLICAFVFTYEKCWLSNGVANDLIFLAFQLNVLVRFNKLEKEVKEGNAMMRTTLSDLDMSVEANEDPMDQMDSEEELKVLEDTLKGNPTYRKKMVSAYNCGFVRSVE